jgi:hypothetical protein
MTRGFSIVVTRAGGGRASRNNEQWRATARKHAILADCAHDSCSGVHCRSRPCTAMHCLCAVCELLVPRFPQYDQPTVLLAHDRRYTACCLQYGLLHGFLDGLLFCLLYANLFIYLSPSPRLLIHDYVCSALYRPDVRHQPGRC